MLNTISTEGLICAALFLASAPMNERSREELDLLMLQLMERLSHSRFNELCAEIEDLQK